MRTLRTRVAFALLASFAVLASTAPADATPPPGPFENIHVIDFEGEIGPLLLAYTRRRVEAAEAAGADCIVLRVDSYGGRVDSSKEIGDMLVELDDAIHVVAWVPEKAISGAAFVSLACDEIIMAAGASIGDCQPIVQGATGKPEAVGEKIESPLRAWFRRYASANGYPVLLAEAMVSERMEVIRLRPKAGGEMVYMGGEHYRQAGDDAELLPGLLKQDLSQVGPPVIGKGELLTFTADQALEFDFIKRRFDGGLPDDEDQVLAALKAPGAQVTFTEMSFSESASKWLLTIAGILSAIVAMAVLVFMWQGPGLMTIVGGVALVLVILINVTADQLHGFPIFLILVGIGLLAVEMFVFPGFGVPGLLGVASMATGFLFLATGSTIGDTGGLDSEALLSFGLQFVFTAIAGFVALLVLSRFVPRVGPARRMVLQPSGAPPMVEQEPAAHLPSVGAVGEAKSPLRPAGTAEFDGRLCDVVSSGEFIATGDPVRIVGIEGERITVAPAGTAGDAPGGPA